MSLLLEALKKAERDKLGLDPAQRNATGQSALSSSSSSDEAAAEETLPGYSIHPAAPSVSLGGRQKSAEEPERKAAQNVFTAKQDDVGGGVESHDEGQLSLPDTVKCE